MSAILHRIGLLLVAVDLLYLVIAEAYWGGVDEPLFRSVLWGGGIFIVGGSVVWLAGRAAAGVSSRSCARCRRKVARGRVYCDDHFQESINEYRDQERQKGG